MVMWVGCVVVHGLGLVCFCNGFAGYKCMQRNGVTSFHGMDL